MGGGLQVTVFTQRYKAVKTAGGFAFTFYCDLCERGVEVPEIALDSFEEAFPERSSLQGRISTCVTSAGAGYATGTTMSTQ